MTHYMFAYGANTNTPKMISRCPKARLVGKAWIEGYAFRWRSVADIEFSDDDYVVGLLWEITDDDLASLDRYEGYPRKYFRQRVRINCGDAVHVGWAYMMTNQSTEAEPSSAYRDTLYEGYKQNELTDDQLTKGLSRIRG